MTFDLPAQKEICDRFGAPFLASDPLLKVGICLAAKGAEGPFHGLRHRPEGDTTGWYIWVGELSDADDFFVPLHAGHLSEWAPSVMPYLGLAPGWRFLIDEGHEDVWSDAELL